MCSYRGSTDWPKHETFEAKFAGGSLKSARVNGVDALWADNWDDDDIEDSWARQLRCASF